MIESRMDALTGRAAAAAPMVDVVVVAASAVAVVLAEGFSN